MQTDDCDPIPCLSPAAQRLLDVDKEWVLKTTHIDLPMDGTYVKVLDYNPLRIKFTICNRFALFQCHLTQRIPSEHGGSFIGIEFYETGTTSQESMILERNIEYDKAECTNEWWSFGDATNVTCLYISEVIYRGVIKDNCFVKRSSEDCHAESKRRSAGRESSDCVRNAKDSSSGER